MDQESSKIKKEEFKKQNKVHELIRNDEDYDDWEYGTEPIMFNSWNDE